MAKSDGAAPPAFHANCMGHPSIVRHQPSSFSTATPAETGAGPVMCDSEHPNFSTRFCGNSSGHPTQDSPPICSEFLGPWLSINGHSQYMAPYLYGNTCADPHPAGATSGIFRTRRCAGLRAREARGDAPGHWTRACRQCTSRRSRRERPALGPGLFSLLSLTGACHVRELARQRAGAER